jgi:cyclopropane fatty-acyl-phospholipid synthase-like methyltransferase
MAGFDNPLETWNARFARDGFLFGEEPNAFLRTQAHWLRPGDSVLCVADGEGRNSVWLAEQDFQVTAFDFAPNAVAKAKRLAQRRNVSVNHELGDAYTWPWTIKRYDALVAVFIQFLPPDFRDSVFAGMKSAVEPGGLFLLEGYRPEQVDYCTGGPPRREHMYMREWLESTFSGWEILVLRDYDAVIQEGQAHNGMSALIDLVARNPVA